MFLLCIWTILRFILGEFGGSLLFWGILASVVAFFIGIILFAYYSSAKDRRLFKEIVDFAVFAQGDPLIVSFKVFIVHYALVMDVSAEYQVKNILKEMQESMPPHLFDNLSALSTADRLSFYLGAKRDSITDALLCGDAFKSTILASKLLPVLEPHQSCQASSNGLPCLYANIMDRLVDTMTKVEYCKFREEVDKAIPSIMNCSSFAEISLKVSPSCFTALYYTFLSDLVLNKYGRSFILREAVKCKKAKADGDLFLLMLEEYKEALGKVLFDKLVALVLQRSLEIGEQVSRVDYLVEAVLTMNADATKIASNNIAIDIAS